ncbi:MAG: prolyl oligopeptidase family serine peptidase [Planctomycetes bacterium]|nr:prolyl oligopeptidase family serine peptidase [Planctomycetota bacterium]
MRSSLVLFLLLSSAAPLAIAQTAKAQTAKAQTANAEPTPGRQVEQVLKVGDVELPYLCYLPETYAESDEVVPLLLFLHGRGESNGPLSRVASWGPPKYLAAGERLPYVVLSPQCPKSDRWNSDTQQQQLVALLDHAERTWRIDPQRICVTGLSMGGFGTWRLCADHPERFAAAVPVCGGGDPAWGEKLTALPIWVWHGEADRAVPFAKSVEMVDAIRAAGGERVRFTTLEHIGHNAWESAYRSPEVWSWLGEQRAARQR